MKDDEFFAAFEAATPPREEWTHEAHVRMGCLLLRRLPLDEAIPWARERIRRYNAAHGNRTGYHETITVAFLTLISAAMEKEASETWEIFRAAHAELVADGLAVLLRHYDRETLFSPEARSTFVPPRNPFAVSRVR